MNYLALVISPVMATIASARKTRQLWAASFVFSRLMYHLLAAVKPYGDVIAPAYGGNEKLPHRHGAGLWPDRCLVRLNGNELPDPEQIKKEAFDRLAQDLGTPNLDLADLFQVQCLAADWSVVNLPATAINEHDTFPVHRLNRLLDNLELRPPYQPRESRSLIDLLTERIHDLYRTANHQRDDKTIFLDIYDANGHRQPPPRLPSLPEIALREFAYLTTDDPARQAYDDIVKSVIDTNVLRLRQLPSDKRAKDLDEDGQRINEAFYVNLKAAFKQSEATIKLRHKYVAVVQMDGDGLGKAITNLSQNDPDGSHFARFSNDLMQFSLAAVSTIVDYGGLPVFAGGDDLVFLAPVSMPHGDIPNVFALCQALNQDFQRRLPGHGVSLSGGVSISYYKFPLGEAVATAGDLEHLAKKTAWHYSPYWQTSEQAGRGPNAPLPPAVRKKNAIAFAVRKHSGQTFSAVLSMGAEASFQQIVDLLQPDPALDQAFLTSAMRKLQQQYFLLAEAAYADRLEAFRTHNFNKGGRHDDIYLDRVFDLTKAVFQEYGDLLEADLSSTNNPSPARPPLNPELARQRTDTLFAVLRLHQFLNQADHD